MGYPVISQRATPSFLADIETRVLFLAVVIAGQLVVHHVNDIYGYF